MTIAKKIYITLIIGLFLGLIVKESMMDRQLQSSQKVFVKTQAQEITNYVLATREYYAEHSSKAHPSNDDIEKFYKSKSKHHFIIKTVSDKPVLPSNIADKFELESIKIFDKNKKLKEQFRVINQIDMNTTKEYYHYTYALRVKDRCLQCHVNYKFGDTRGILSIKIPKKPFDDDRINLSNKSYIDTFIVMLIIFLVLYYIVIKPLSINMRKLQYDLNLFFGFLNDEEEESHFEAIDTKDELGIMSKDIDKNIIKAKDMIKIQRQYQEELQLMIDERTQEILNTTLHQYKFLSKKDTQKNQFELKQVVQDCNAIFKNEYSNNNIKIIDEFEHISILSYKNELLQVLFNLLKYSIKGLRSLNLNEKIIIISTHKENNNAILTIKSNNGGLDDNILKKIYDKNIDIHKELDISLLNLYIAKKLVQEHFNSDIIVENIDIDYENNIYKGTQISISVLMK